MTKKKRMPIIEVQLLFVIDCVHIPLPSSKVDFVLCDAFLQEAHFV